MKVAIRSDAGIHIGTGHIMRCLTLAQGLRKAGADVHFICRAHDGHLGDRILADEHKLYLLPKREIFPTIASESGSYPSHSSWLGESWNCDFEQTLSLLSHNHFDLLIVDHYSLDFRWETASRAIASKILVIDDLADRRHECDILLDQTHGRRGDNYRGLVQPDCELLLGSFYALLRPEFAANRKFSLERRKQSLLNRLLVMMGGVDRDNITSEVLLTLESCKLSSNTQITVVMGPHAPWSDHVQGLARYSRYTTRVVVDLNSHEIADQMMKSDLAIGASGATAWERCCLGLPALMFTIAENQKSNANALSTSGAAYLLESTSEIESKIKFLMNSESALFTMSNAASKITDGLGLMRVINVILRECEYEDHNLI